MGDLITNYTILEQCNPAPSAVPEFCQPGFFFNEVEHLRQQSNGQFHLLTAVNQTTWQAEARCAFFVDSDKAVSPRAAPFGSIEFTESLPDPVLNAFLDSILDAVRSAGASTLRLVNYPHCYAPEQAKRLTNKLLDQGFRVIKNDQNFFLPVTNSSFESTIHQSERRRLRKCQKAGFQFDHWESPNVIDVIAFLQETRQQQGYPLTISAERLANLLNQFPNQFRVFMVKDGEKLAALTVMVRVRHDILYNFLPASHADYCAFSPMVMLTDGLFMYCQQQQIQLLDLGVSLDNDRQPKPTLMRFKRNLGAQSSPKLVFEMSF